MSLFQKTNVVKSPIPNNVYHPISEDGYQKLHNETSDEEMMDDEIPKNLTSMNHTESLLLTKFSYIDFDVEKLAELQKNGIVTVRDLFDIVEREDSPYLGGMAKTVTGIDSTSKDVLKEMVEHGFGDMEILGVQDDSKTGFYGVALRDEFGNVALSFRGTDVAKIGELANDSMTDVKEFITESNSQVKEAEEFYEKYAKDAQSVYLYGHSLGGNLVEHVYLSNCEEIEDAFVVNALPISQSLLDTNDKVNAFNDSSKFHCYVVGGDWVSELRDTDLYENNIQYVKNNNSLTDNLLSDHALEAASFLDDGNFEVVSKDVAIQGHKHVIERIATQGASTIGNYVQFAYRKLK